MSSDERERKMKEFAEANKHPVEYARRQREKEATQKEMTGGQNIGGQDSPQAPWSQRRKGDMR